MTTTTLGDLTLHNADCMELLRSYPDNAFDLAIVDPPYGDGNQQVTNRGGGYNRFGQRFDRYKKAPPNQLAEQAAHGRPSTPKKLSGGM